MSVAIVFSVFSVYLFPNCHCLLGGSGLLCSAGRYQVGYCNSGKYALNDTTQQTHMGACSAKAHKVVGVGIIF